MRTYAWAEKSTGRVLAGGFPSHWEAQRWHTNGGCNTLVKAGVSRDDMEIVERETPDPVYRRAGQSASLEFCRAGRTLTEAIHAWAVGKGFWDFEDPDTDAVKGLKLALCHSELSEVLEGARDGNPLAEKVEGFTQEEEELADLVIRVLDYAGQYRLRVPEAMLAKMEVNEGRPYKHGRQF